ncbi:PepSY-associated TM helix domain-containing protein [Pseudorhodoplanes sp.]|uniref:PepSY-associated TM helix domain-containing protein n=1 Tax=Pseudorhodoplanes sp. TaxID=1934341 RepID=UPI002B92B99A|nr:PepSY-associated TM helix domain-containing protein [Pseudorhodoplanes sp.]HWV54034.1 PepSY-associated TM helix domain-containing protein [Pseudorhodoplanes sp.]
MKSKLTLGSRAFWLRQMRQWHWISAAVCLIGMLLFAVTGITLNHAGRIESKPVVSERTATMPAPLVEALTSLAPQGKALVPDQVAAWTSMALRIDIGGREAELSPGEVYIALPRPGGDAWLSLDRKTGEARYELTDRGWISYLNDLHKGRNTGAAWSLFIDVFAVACIVFCVTGLVLMQLLAHARPSTWPLVGLGLLIPALIALAFIH